MGEAMMEEERLARVSQPPAKGKVKHHVPGAWCTKSAIESSVQQNLSKERKGSEASSVPELSMPSDSVDKAKRAVSSQAPRQAEQKRQASQAQRRVVLNFGLARRHALSSPSLLDFSSSDVEQNPPPGRAHILSPLEFVGRHLDGPALSHMRSEDLVFVAERPDLTQRPMTTGNINISRVRGAVRNLTQRPMTTDNINMSDGPAGVQGAVQKQRQEVARAQTAPATAPAAKRDIQRRIVPLAFDELQKEIQRRIAPLWKPARGDPKNFVERNVKQCNRKLSCKSRKEPLSEAEQDCSVE